MGLDAEHRQWAWWVEQGHLCPVQVYKASHHSSRNGDTAAALSILRPEMVIVSAGGRDQYGHPHSEALGLDAAQRVVVYRTDPHGTIVVEAEASGR